MSRNSWPGEDEISAKFLKIVKSAAPALLSDLFEQSLDSSAVPFVCRTAQAKPVF